MMPSSEGAKFMSAVALTLVLGVPVAALVLGSAGTLVIGWGAALLLLRTLATRI